jgi:ATP-dependent RNA helicase DDX54/DBP10
LIVTDIAARGIDIPILDNVINLHFPSKAKLFMHRVGRVARAGRPGSAFSILSPDEVAFLFDLHLFLGRPLNFDSNSNSNPNDDCFVGRIPQDLLDQEHSYLKQLEETNSEMSSLAKVARNGYAQYLKSRPPASAESNKRAKEVIVSNLEIHPIFGQFYSKKDPMSELVGNLVGWRPKSTIFEIGPKAGSETNRVMHEKRLRDQALVEKHRMKRAAALIEEKSGRKDENNFIGYLPKDHHTEEGLSIATTFERQIQASVLDLTVDDSKMLKNQSSKLKWDRKKKKFVGSQNSTHNGKKIKTESGRWISSSYKSQKYEQNPELKLVLKKKKKMTMTKGQ